MGQDELAQEVLTAPPVALVKEQQHPRCADSLAGKQAQVRAGQPGFEAYLAAFIAGELCRPLTAPAHGGDHTALRTLQVEEGQHLVGGAPTAWLETAFLPVSQDSCLRCKIIKGGHSAFGPV